MLVEASVRGVIRVILLFISSDEIFYILWSKCQSTENSYVYDFKRHVWYQSHLLSGKYAGPL